MQKGMVSQCFKSNPKFSVKDIFLDNHNWDVYEHQYKDDLRQVEIEEVEKMLSCKKGPPSKHVLVWELFRRCQFAPKGLSC